MCIFYIAKVKNIFVAINPLNCRICTRFYLQAGSRFVVEKSLLWKYTIFLKT